ncbi:MAG: hypothetical protein OHK93_002919 [Ramalina farinacea]|uniref:Uncharacterized protein n=1 Tax=Ramalina farinacea TaxID=258253 RepID=A0AA43QU33_9LECA|nr:hypothetical protein [Ramalina farinacea]
MLCETATYINAIDLLVYLAFRPAAGLQESLFHRTPGAVYNQVFIRICGATDIESLRRDRAQDGLYKALEYMAVLHSFYAMTQETLDSQGQRIAFVQFFSAYSTSPTPGANTLTVTKRGNTTELDNDSCNEPSAVADLQGENNTTVADTWQPSTNSSIIDTLLESPTSIELPANDTNSASNDDWFIWQDPNFPTLQMRCRFLPGPGLSWSVAYLPFARSIWQGDLSYEQGLDNPAMSVDLYNPRAHIHFRVGGYPTGIEINPGFTNHIALLSLGRIPRILFEKKTWRGIQVQVISEGETVGVVVMISDRAPTLQNTAGSSVDVA